MLPTTGEERFGKIAINRTQAVIARPIENYKDQKESR